MAASTRPYRRRAVAGALLIAALALFLVVVRSVVRSGDLSAALVGGSPLLVAGWLDLRAARRLTSSRPCSRGAAVLIGLVLVASLSMLAYSGGVAYVDRRLEARTYAGVYAGKHRVWATRGLVLDGPQILRDGRQNSIESVRLAFDRGAEGTEVDIFFDVPTGRFVVSHDRQPYNLKDGEILTLASLLATTAERGYFWLDFKKLRLLDADELQAAVALLLELTAPGDLRTRIYVEGEDPFNLSAFRRAGFHTILDTHPLPDDHIVTPLLVNLYKLLYYFGGFTVMAMEYGDDAARPVYGRRTREALADVPVFLYHAPDDPELLAALCALPAVRVVLVADHSSNRYGITASSPNDS